MSSILHNVDQKTKIAGSNRIELLIFKLSKPQFYGINVFKVKEIRQGVKITVLPGRVNQVIGVSTIRDRTIPIFDLGYILEGVKTGNLDKAILIVTEYNTSVIGFVVDSVNRIISLEWDKIHPLPYGNGTATYLTAVSEVDDEVLEIIDVEKILDEVSPSKCIISNDLKDKIPHDAKEYNKKIIFCDDSAVARDQVLRALHEIDPSLTPLVFKNGKEVWDFLVAWAENTDTLSEKLLLLISDIEMPEMDGYTLATKIKENKKLKDIYIVLHSSLSGVFNKDLVEKVGANKFVAKFDPNAMANLIIERINNTSKNVI